MSALFDDDGRVGITGNDTVRPVEAGAEAVSKTNDIIAGDFHVNLFLVRKETKKISARKRFECYGVAGKTLFYFH